LAELFQATEVRGGCSLAGFDLQTDRSAVVVLDDEVDLGSVTRTSMAQGDGLVQPGCLLAHLADDERLQQVAEVGESSRVKAGQLVGVEPQQPGREP